MTQRSEKSGHDLLSIETIRQRAKVGEGRLIELDHFTVAERYAREREIGVRQDAVRRGRCAGERAHIREKPFLRGRKRMCGSSRDVLEVEAIDLQTRFIADEFIDPPLFESENLRFQKRHFGRFGRRELDHLLLHAKVRRVTRVLVGEHLGIHVKARQFLVETEVFVQRVRKRRRGGAQLALEHLHLRQFFCELFLRAAPRLVVGVDVG